MASERPNQTAIDYITIVLSPVLVMGLVGSLVFFLLEVVYKSDGQWRDRLQWILFFFVFGAVLVARISMHGEISGRAGIYGTALGLATYLGMQSFIEYPPGIRELSFLVNLGLIIIVLWCSYRLTWDCTNVDEETDMSGEGLLQAAGIEEVPPTEQHPEANNDDEPILLEEEPRGGIDGWWERYQRYREKRNKKRTLGIWVVYFSLAALPIFGLGQALIPITAPERRRFAFWLMTIYVACGLGLLLTTCFLSLRRYLRQKRLQMPLAMTGAWLSMGGALLLMLLVIGALLPRPYAEYSLTEMFRQADSARNASKYAVKGDSPGKGQGRPGEGRPDGKAGGNQTGKDGKGRGQGKDGKGDGKGDGKDGRGQGKDGQNRSNTGQQSKDGQQGKDGQQRGNNRNNSDRDPQKGQPSRGGDKSSQEQDPEGRQAGTSEQGKPPTNAVQQMLQKISPILKWLILAAIVLVVLLALFRGGLGFLANFTQWAKNLLEAWRRFWANLFGGQSDTATDVGQAGETEAEPEPELPFHSFRNPFDSGRASRMSPQDLVRYTFRATEAWARERDLGRNMDETAMEFLRRLAEELPAMETEAARLAHLHARAEYGRGGLPQATPEQIRLFWEKLERMSVTPMSA